MPRLHVVDALRRAAATASGFLGWSRPSTTWIAPNPAYEWADANDSCTTLSAGFELVSAMRRAVGFFLSLRIRLIVPDSRATALSGQHLFLKYWTAEAICRSRHVANARDGSGRKPSTAPPDWVDADNLSRKDRVPRTGRRSPRAPGRQRNARMGLSPASGRRSLPIGECS